MSTTISCRHCGANIVGGNAGELKKCGTCGEWVNIPITGSRPEVEYASPSGTETNWNKVFDIVAVVVGVGITGLILAMLLLPAVNGGRFPKRPQCQNHLKQIALAFHNYHDEHKTFPPAYVLDENGRPEHSWRVLILRHLGEYTFHDQYNFDEPWNSPHNLKVAQYMPNVYKCPSSENISDNHTAYQVIVGPRTAFPGAQSSTFSDIRDGSPNTILVVEAAGSPVLWTKPADLDFSKMRFTVGGGPGEIDSVHRGGAHVGMIDGSTTWLTDDTPPHQVRAMVVIDDAVRAAEHSNRD